MELLHVGVAVDHQPLKAHLEVNAVLEVPKGVQRGGWPPRGGAEGASRSAQP